MAGWLSNTCLRALLAAAVLLCASCASKPSATPFGDHAVYRCVGPFLDDAPCSQDHPANRINSADNTRVMVLATSAILAAAAAAAGERGVAAGGAGNIERQAGMAAGDSPLLGWSVWVAGNSTKTENDFPSTRHEAVLDVVMGGVDALVTEELLVGLALGRESNEVSTAFNVGSQDISGHTVAAYLGYQLSAHFSVDFAAGFTSLDMDQARTDPFSAPLVRNNVVGNTGADRWFTSANLNAFTQVHDWELLGRVGVVLAREQQDAFTETGGSPGAAGTVPKQRVDFGQWQLGAEVAYLGSPVEPYALVALEHDFENEVVRLNAAQQQPRNDDTNVRGGLGLRYFGDGVSGSLELSRTAARDDLRSDSLNLNVRVEF